MKLNKIIFIIIIILIIIAEIAFDVFAVMWTCKLIKWQTSLNDKEKSVTETIDNNTDSRTIINNNENTIIINDSKVATDTATNDNSNKVITNKSTKIKPYYDNSNYNKYTLKYLANEYDDNMGKSRKNHEGEYVEICAYLINVNKEYALLTGTKAKTSNSYRVYALMNDIDDYVDTILDENNNSFSEVVIRGKIVDINEKYHFECSIIVDEILIK